MDLEFKVGNISILIEKNVVVKLNRYKQLFSNVPESGGLLLGRTDINGNTRIIDITEPGSSDIQLRCYFIRRDKKHKELLCKAKNRCLYFKGNWHTHPTENPTPSIVDIFSWKRTLRNDKPGDSDYAYFIIVGINRIKLWAGNMKTKEFEEALLSD